MVILLWTFYVECLLKVSYISYIWVTQIYYQVCIFQPEIIERETNETADYYRNLSSIF